MAVFKIDILVLTSAREAQPLVLLEGMCAGTPCVATDVGCCRDMLEDVGFVTAAARPEETAEAVIKLCKNERLGEELIKKGREMVRLNYNVDDVIESYRDIYFKYSQMREAELLGVYGRDRISAT
ncbi:hypothetical protein ES703_57656 [subsurface metagenome]